MSSAADILAAIPYLLGFHPDASLVVLGLEGQRGLVRFTVRVDLPPAGTQEVDELTGYLGDVTVAQQVGEAVLVAYGPPESADPAVALADQRLRARGIGIREELRAHHGRYWSYSCADPRCCPPAGSPYDVSTSAIAAAATAAGCVALPDRTALQRSVAPVGGGARSAMRQATARAEARLQGWAADCPDWATLHRRLVGEGSARMHAALQGCAAGRGKPSDDETAWLGLLLTRLRIRDEAWLLINGEQRRAHLSLWTHVVRRAEKPYVPAPACLLAFAAWQDGDGALASVAVERALDADSEYSMAGLISAALTRGVRPEAWQPPMRPDELPDGPDPWPRGGQSPPAEWGPG